MEKSGKCSIYLERAAYCIEVIVTVFLLLAIVTLMFQTILRYCGLPVSLLTMDFEQILSKVFVLIIGVEFTKMLCKHTPETVIEVLLFATARQVILSHGSVLNTLIGATAIAVLFAVKKFLLPVPK